MKFTRVKERIKNVIFLLINLFIIFSILYLTFVKLIFFVGDGRIRNWDGCSPTHGCHPDSYNVEHVDQKSKIPSACFFDGEFFSYSWLCRYYVHDVQRSTIDSWEAIYCRLAWFAFVFWHCDIFFWRYHFGKPL